MLKILPLLTLLALLALAPGFTPGATAQTQREELRQQYEESVNKYQEAREDVKQAREEVLSQRCELAETRIDLYTTRYQNNQSRFQKVHERLDEVAEKIIERAQESAKDTGEFEAAVAELQSLAQIANNEYATLMSKLEATKQYACGESEGAFAEALNQSREQFMITRQAVLDARLYYQTDLRPAAQALLNQ